MFISEREKEDSYGLVEREAVVFIPKEAEDYRAGPK
jgi:hypothetical protein